MLIFHQLFDKTTSTYTYLIADSQTKEAAIIDPVEENLEHDLKLIKELELKLQYVLDTHIHADHVTSASKLKAATGCKIVVPSPIHNELVDINIKDGEKLQVGEITLAAIATPGHTNAHMAYLVNKDRVLTGDALFINGCGRTDFQEGNPDTLYDSITQRLFTLPDETLVFPGHDYKGLKSSTIGDEKKNNPRLAGKSKEEFIEIMKNLNLSKPAKMETCVPMNVQSGEENNIKLSQASSQNFWKTPDDTQNIKKPDSDSVAEFKNKLTS